MGRKQPFIARLYTSECAAAPQAPARMSLCSRQGMGDGSPRMPQSNVPATMPFFSAISAIAGTGSMLVLEVVPTVATTQNESFTRRFVRRPPFQTRGVGPHAEFAIRTETLRHVCLPDTYGR